MPLTQICRLTGAGSCVGVCLPGLTPFPLSRRSTTVDCPLNQLVSVLSLEEEGFQEEGETLGFLGVLKLLGEVIKSLIEVTLSLQIPPSLQQLHRLRHSPGHHLARVPLGRAEKVEAR